MLRVFNDYEELSRQIAKKILEVFTQKPTACVVLTSGNTPLRTYEILVETAPSGIFDEGMIVGLDEWVGMNKDDEGSCGNMVYKTLIEPLNLIHFTFFDGKLSDLQSECKRVDSIIEKRGGLDFVLVGLGLNGHIGLNEPGYSFDCLSHVTDLEPITVTTAQKYFNSHKLNLQKGITIGLGHMLNAKEVIILANGAGKTKIVNKLQKTDPTEAIPATFIKKHLNGHLWIDKEVQSR